MSSSRGLGDGETSLRQREQRVGRLPHRGDRPDDIEAPALRVDESPRDEPHLLRVRDGRAAELHHDRVGRRLRHAAEGNGAGYGTSPGRRYGERPGGTAIPGRSDGSGTGASACTTRGRCPAQTSRSASGVSPSSGTAVADLGGRLVDGKAEHRGRLELLPRGRPRLGPAAGQELLGERLERDELLVGLVDGHGGAEDDHRAVVHRVLEHRAREDDPVEQRDREADGDVPGAAPGACGWRPSRARRPGRPHAPAGWG